MEEVIPSGVLRVPDGLVMEHADTEGYILIGLRYYKNNLGLTSER